MFLHIIKIKINIYIFYTSYGTAMNGQSIPLSHLTELKSECSKYCHLYWNYGLYVHRKQNPWEAVRLFFFFFSSSSALLGGSQFWGSGCKTFAPYSLPSFRRPSHLTCRRGVPLLREHPEHLCTRVHGTHWECGGFTRCERWSRWVLMLSFLHGNSTAIKVTGFCAFHQRSSYMGRCEESTGMTKGNGALNYMIRKQYICIDCHCYF